MSAFNAFKRFIILQQRNMLSTVGGAINYMYVIPAIPIISWIAFPTLDLDIQIASGLRMDPDEPMLTIQRQRHERYELYTATKQQKKPAKEEEEEEEEEEEAPAGGGGDDEEEEGGGAEEEGGGGGGDEGDEEEEDDEEVKKLPKPAFLVPHKGKNLTREQMWNNFGIKAITYSDDDDDDDDEDDE